MLFVVAAPWTPVLALIHNFIEIRIDTFKLCFAHQRPWPRKAQDIGTWQDIFTVIVGLSIVINAAIMVFVLEAPLSRSLRGVEEDDLDDFRRQVAEIPDDILSEYGIVIGGNATYSSPYMDAEKVWTFNLIQYLCFSIMLIIAVIIPDIPDEVEIQLARQEQWRDRLIKLEEDEDDEDEVGAETGSVHENKIYDSFGALQRFEKDDNPTLDTVELNVEPGERVLAQMHKNPDCPFAVATVVHVLGGDGTFDLKFADDTLKEGVPASCVKKYRTLLIDTGDGDDQTTEGIKGIMGRVRPLKYDLDQEEEARRLAKAEQRQLSAERHAAKLASIYGE